MSEDVRRILTEYVQHIGDKIDFLRILFYELDRKEEAMTLCCIYIEGLAQRLHEEDSRRNSKRLFVKVLLEYGGEELLCLVDPPTLAESLKGVGDSALSKLAGSIQEHYCTVPTELLRIDDLVDLARDEIPAEQLTLLQDHAWRGTIAALAYRYLRSPLAHGEALAPAGLICSNTVFEGEPVGRVSFDKLYPALWRVWKFWGRQFVNSYRLNPD